MGLRRVKEFNDACLLHLAWFAIKADSLWSNWLRERYFIGPSIWNYRNPRCGSCIWKKLRSVSPILQRDSKWILVNGKSINLWYDNWIDLQPIAPKFPRFQFSVDDLVANIIVENAWHIPNQLLAQL